VQKQRNSETSNLIEKIVFLKEKNGKEDSAQGCVSVLDNVQSVLLISKGV
jgi:hypothetical protein